MDFNRLPSNIIKRGCLAAPVKKFFYLEVVTIMIEIENDFDPIEAPPGPYNIQPEYQGGGRRCLEPSCE